MRHRAHGLAVDLGASSGRIFLVGFDGERVELTGVDRFKNGGVRSKGRLRWPASTILREVVAGTARAAETAGSIEAISVDGWGVDFALLDRCGRLIGDPVHYRDERTAGVPDRAERTMSAERLYALTGIPPLQINTLYQLLSEPRQLEGAASLLFMPDLIHHWLCGSECTERTIASTSQMLAASGADWEWAVLDRFGIPGAIMPPLATAGTDLGPLVGSIAENAGLAGARVVMPAAHDTASAWLGLPRDPGQAVAWVSSGTWSVVGVDSDRPALSEDALRHRISNEPAPFGGTLITRNVMGMWLLQECRRRWAKASELTEPELVRLAEREAPCAQLIDPDDPLFLTPGDMPALIREAVGSDRASPVRPGAMVRCILESVAAKTKWALERCAAVAGASYEAIHVVGGGSKLALLNQLIADFTGRPVIAGPSEASVLGIAAVQLVASGRIGTHELAELLRASVSTRVFDPSPATAIAQERFAAWEAQLADQEVQKRAPISLTKEVV